MKRLALFLAIVLLFTIFIPVPVSVSASYQVPFEVQAKAVYLVNLDTGQVVYEKNAQETVFPASVTKIMTAVLVLENVRNIDTETIIVEPYMLEEFQNLGYSYSNAGLLNYEEFTVRDLLYAILIQSASDAADVLAAHVGGGSISTFVSMMNDKARELGMTGTQFANPHGLHNDNHYTTAYDLYILTTYAMKLPGFMDMVQTNAYDFVTNLRPSSNYLITTNYLQDNARHPELYYAPIRGIKTGTTDEAGSCLVSTATKDGYTYLLILMGAPLEDEEGETYAVRQAFVETPKLYNWAFDNFSVTPLINESSLQYEIPLELCWGKDFLQLKIVDNFDQLFPNNYDTTSLQKVYRLPDSIKAPVDEGALVGTMDLILSGELIGTVNLYAAESVERSLPLFLFSVVIEGIKTTWFKLGILFFALFWLFFIICSVVTNRYRRMYANRKRKRY